jgi:hypothetical protein
MTEAFSVLFWGIRVPVPMSENSLLDASPLMRILFSFW